MVRASSMRLATATSVFESNPKKAIRLLRKDWPSAARRALMIRQGEIGLRQQRPTSQAFMWGIGSAANNVAIPDGVAAVSSIDADQGLGFLPRQIKRKSKPQDRRTFIGGSDARIIMGADEDALLRLWQEKRGEVEPPDLAGNLAVQLGSVTEELNRRWFERSSNTAVKDVQKHVRHPVHTWMGATLDGIVDATGAVFEAKFMLPWSFSEEAAAEKHMAQLQHNMWVVGARASVLSIITGGGKWVELAINADPLYQHLLITAERKFWHSIQDGQPPRVFGIELPKPNLGAVRVVDMTASNVWADQAAIFRRTRDAYVEHDSAKSELKSLMPADAKEAMGHGLRAKRSKSGAVSFELVEMGAADAPVQ